MNIKKNSLPDTPSINVRDSQYIEEIPKITLELCSKYPKKAINPDEEAFQGTECEGEYHFLLEKQKMIVKKKVFRMRLLPRC